ncbi:MAG TPA: tRNA pseudouridine(55) synthase TruB [Candidatus Marinimicrobia bacterium]|nr:MAG: tRNA pseudouridine(55) synthase TruB [Candidatus Marinimicrobia bacterium CG1_02_48_14]PJA54517.1 MAG: tRNA pseudouridine(55) synthase TruB [Candidatus Marinimicrobia bacterium CG_4_9_14_3_um_filter_48_9]HCW75403.1 tRNA pseudouridine(55) synthase TruB [Candidatus Neomarinimicrobiota bacterium]
MNLTADNVFNIDKPIGWTSFDVVKKVRGITHIKKVGHAGTLDPFATGVLLVLTGSQTKLQTTFTDLRKVYVATVSLGSQTDTGDYTGSVISEDTVPNMTRAELESNFGSFVGDIFQVPPMFSAKKVNGQTLYKLARKGRTVEREPHPISIFSIELIDMQLPNFTMKVHCGKGTYIRTLAEDIAVSVGTVGHLTALRRLAIGEFVVEDAESITTFEERWKSCAA